VTRPLLPSPHAGWRGGLHSSLRLSSRQGNPGLDALVQREGWAATGVARHAGTYEAGLDLDAEVMSQGDPQQGHAVRQRSTEPGLRTPVCLVQVGATTR
jgi:hypothetical protein